MFEHRLRILLVVLGVVLLVLVGRLGQLQLVRGDLYRRRAQQSLLRRPHPVPFVRGSILDRTGRVLVSDEPSWVVAVEFDVLAAQADHESAAMRRMIRRCKRSRRYPAATGDDQIRAAFLADLDAMWIELARFAAEDRAITVDSFSERAADILDRTRRIRRAVARRRGYDAPVLEERTNHAMLSGLSAARQVAARERFRRYPWLHVETGSVRRFVENAAPLAHVLGRLGRVDADVVASDPNADDPFARYLAYERVGVSGVERAAEPRLRGRRGQLVRDRRDRVVDEAYIEPESGADVTLTLDAPLQQRLYALLEETVTAHPDSSGGAMVVLDIPTREVLALVSYPSYDPNRFGELYPTLVEDTRATPLRFRAVAGRYAPGSTVKPLICLAGLLSGTIDLGFHDRCTGYLFDDQRDRWRCWSIHGTGRRKAHGDVDIVAALTGSCNVFMYRLGERIGIDRLCSTFDMVGIGRLAGTGLGEEVRGINPTPGWLMARKNMRPTPGTARLYAIGQGEVAMTPVQVANLMATYASGQFRYVTLIRGGPQRPTWTIPATAAQWSAIRRGIYGVVNDADGTAHKYAFFKSDRVALCGKTGSATAGSWPTAYDVSYTDDDGVRQTVRVPAGARREAIDRFRASHPYVPRDSVTAQVARRWPPHDPPPGERFSHAWFAGFLQRLGGDGQPDWSHAPRTAFAVLVEFGGSGGRTTGPLARRIAAELAEYETRTTDTGL